MDWTKTPESHRVQFLNNHGQGNGANDSLQLIQVPPSPGSTQLQEPGESGASGGHGRLVRNQQDLRQSCLYEGLF